MHKAGGRQKGDDPSPRSSSMHFKKGSRHSRSHPGCTLKQNYSCPGRVWLATSLLETGMSLTFFYSAWAWATKSFFAALFRFCLICQVIFDSYMYSKGFLPVYIDFLLSYRNFQTCLSLFFLVVSSSHSFSITFFCGGLPHYFKRL
jgi:hypothetical protein